MFNHLNLLIKYLGKNGAWEVGMIGGRVRSLRKQHSIQFAKIQLIGPMMLMSRISPPKALQTKHIYLNNKYSPKPFLDKSDITSRKKGLFKFIFSYGFP